METFAPAFAIGFLAIVIRVVSETKGQFELLTAFNVKVTLPVTISEFPGI